MIILNAQVDSLTTRKDKTIKLTFVTQELPPKDAGELFGMQNELVGLGIARNSLTSEEVDLLRDNKFGIDSIPNQKSQSKIIRNTMYVLWTQNNEGFEDFTGYYNNKTNQIIIHLKQQIED
jgi:hypothetical protein